MRSFITKATVIALSVFMATVSQAVTVAGWDFSQYYADGNASINGSTPVGTLDANYSFFDPTGNAGFESAAFGDATLGAGIEPRGGDVAGNIKGASSGLISNSFNAFTTLQLEGQTNTNVMSLTAPSFSGTVTFEADMSSLGQGGYGWAVSFGARVDGGTSASVDVDFSANCSSYQSFGSVLIDEQDGTYRVDLEKVSSDNACVRLTIPHTTGQVALIDNVAIETSFVPEPAMALQLMAGVLGLAAVARRRA